MCWLAIAVVIVGCGKMSPTNTTQPSKRPVEQALSVYNPPTHDGYVGSAACSKCHEQIAESYRSHPMASSIRKVDGSIVGGETNARVDGDLRFYEVGYRDEGMFHCEKMESSSGERLFEQAVRMHYVVGSGRRAFAYLHQQDDLLFQSPLNWYSGEEKWDLSPGYVKDDPRRFRRRITDDCLACHAGRVASTGRSLNRYRTPAFHEMSIGCENCHGPGADHIGFHNGDTPAIGVTDPIVNPARLSVAARESVCNQCHLQAVARVLRPGRSHFDFRPGQNLDEIWTVLDAGVDISSDGQTRAVNHVQQMRASRCYSESSGQLGCISCHDPHRLPSADTRISFYRTRCLSCHQDNDCKAEDGARQRQDDSCIECHMPSRVSNNISHVSQTDHRIVRQPVEPSESKEPSEIRLQFFDKANERIEKWEADRAMATAVWLYVDKKGLPAPSSLGSLLTPALQVFPDDHLALTVLGAFSRQQGRTRHARDYFERARGIPPGEESAVSGLLTLNYLESRREPALQCADRMIELDPGEARFHSLRADILWQIGRTNEGIAAANLALKLNPTLIPVREWLVDALRKADRVKEHDEARRMLEKMKQVVASAAQRAKDSEGPERP
jgi:hypothetical protein